jgi:hypothetical protein
VAGNAAVTTPESAGFVSVVDPATVKKSAATPVRVKPGLAVRVMVAVYICEPKNGLATGDQVTVPVY